MPFRNILILLVCQLISATGAIVLVTLGGIIGASLTQNPALATLPVSIMVVCVAATTIPATVLMKKIGRKTGFSMASLCSVFSLLLAAYALNTSSFSIFIVAAGMFGINMAFTQQYRYAAVESVPAEYAPRAISFVLLGPIGGALVGPELIRYGQYFFSVGCALSRAGSIVLRPGADARGRAGTSSEGAKADRRRRPATNFSSCGTGRRNCIRRDDTDHDCNTVEYAH
jgi:hypothetical protein